MAYGTDLLGRDAPAPIGGIRDPRPGAARNRGDPINHDPAAKLLNQEGK
jgi:hypothetical protein